MAPICLAAPSHAVISVSASTSLVFDPMDLDTFTMPHGRKRKLCELYETMGESNRKRIKTQRPSFISTWASRKHEARVVSDFHLSTPECRMRAAALCKEVASKCLFFQCMPNSYTFDFGLGSNTQHATTSPAGKSRAHDATMYLFRGNMKRPFAAEFLAFAYPPPVAPSPAPVDLAPSPAPVDMAPSPTPIVDPATAPPPTPISAPVPALVSAPAPSVQDQDTSMDVVEVEELPLSHPSRLGKSILDKKRDRFSATTFVMNRDLDDIEKEDAKAARIKRAEVLEREHKAEMSKRRKTRGKVVYAGLAAASSEKEKGRVMKVTKKAPKKPTKAPKMVGPFIEEDTDDEEEDSAPGSKR
jgi:hypothetical protein